MEQEVGISIGKVIIRGILSLPDDPRGIVLFAHGSGSGRLSQRNQFVAQQLQQSRIVTLLFDLLNQEEEQDRKNVFDIELLAERLVAATKWVRKQRKTNELPIGYFGASTGAAAALRSAAELGSTIRAIVSRGGRPDLAMNFLPAVAAPTLFIVGENDEEVLKLNRTALGYIKAEKRLAIVPGATHLFEEPGTLEEVAHLASEWFAGHLLQKETKKR